MSKDIEHVHKFDLSRDTVGDEDDEFYVCVKCGLQVRIIATPISSLAWFFAGFLAAAFGIVLGFVIAKLG